MSLALISSVISGYASFHYLTHKDSNVWYKIPDVKITKRIQLSPSIRLFAKGRVFHFHHWFNCGVLLLIASYTNAGILDAVFTKGLLIGGVLQGVSMPEARKLIYKQADSWKNFSRELPRRIIYSQEEA